MTNNQPFSNVGISNHHRWFLPRTWIATARKSSEVKLTAGWRVRAARVWYVVAVEWHHVTEHVRVSAMIWTRYTSFHAIHIHLLIHSFSTHHSTLLTFAHSFIHLVNIIPRY